MKRLVSKITKKGLNNILQREKYVSEYTHLSAKGKGERRKMEIEKLCQTLKSQATRKYISANREMRKTRG